MPARIPMIVGFGGVNATGRLSFDHGYRRMVIDELSPTLQARTYRALAALMGISDDPGAADVQARIRAGTLIRRLEPDTARRMRWHLPLAPSGAGERRYRLPRRQLPSPLPQGWTVVDSSADPVEVEIEADRGLFGVIDRPLRVTSAGQVPAGFNPADHYASRNHPRGLQLTVFGASDALRSCGIPLETLKERVPPDQFAVFSSSAMGQLDNEAYAGMYQNSLIGRRPTAKNVPLGLADMPADFINAYVLGTAGDTAGIVGACASFLYNLKRGVDAIQSGTARVALVGNAESPIVAEVMEGYRTMGALAEDEALALLDQADAPDHRRACRPFSDNCGFTIAESATYTLLMDAELALELGARNLGMVGGVFVNADGYKKSIPGPGIGNYLTVGKAMGLTRSLIGEAGLRQATHVQAHGTGTPQNRTTESAILSELAQAFGISNWPVGAVKAFVGHSFAPAGGDQLAAVLGCWSHGILPGIPTIEHLAEDVHSAGLQFALEPQRLEPDQCRAALINSKGFGGNNATGVILSPRDTETLLETQFDDRQLSAWKERSEAVAEQATAYDDRMLDATEDAIYRFGEGVIDPANLGISDEEIRLPGYEHAVSLRIPDPFRN
ncbi:MAG: beta-ketoacyl synthase [Pseudomonadota bacterium]